MHDRQLVSERDDLQVQGKARADRELERVEQREEDRRHASRLSKNARKLNQRNAYGVFSSHNPLLRPARQQPVHETRRPLPPRRLFGKGTRAGSRDRVVLRLAVVVGGLPGPLDPAPLFQPHERRIESALIQPDRSFSDLFDSGGDAICMLGPHGRERTEHDEIQGARQDIDTRLLSTCLHSGEGVTHFTCQSSGIAQAEDRAAPHLANGALKRTSSRPAIGADGYAAYVAV
jgi:hypothetical protein